MQIKNKVVVVTGGASGIGRALCERFAREGASAVVVSDIDQLGIDHLLIDLPSVDKESDGGKLLAHHAFWQYPFNTKTERTITEMIYVPNTIYDGTYLLNIQIASFENDASPSKPLLFQMNSAL